MPRRFLPIVFILFLIQSAWAQTPEIDSLKALMDNATTDTARIHYTIKYASELTYSNQKESRRLIDDCVLESKKLGYKWVRQVRYTQRQFPSRSKAGMNHHSKA
jgi:hypothetical protein